MALPEPDGIKWMLAPQYVASNETLIRGDFLMDEGSWNVETATIVWTSKRMHTFKKRRSHHRAVRISLSYL